MISNTPTPQPSVPVAPAGNGQPLDPTALANSAASAYDTPALQTAGQNVISSQTAAQQSQAADLTLPQMLQQALAPSIANANDPNTQQTKTDLASELTDLGNPQGIADSAASLVPGAVLSPSQQRGIISSRLGNEGAALSIDNLISGMRQGGLANVIKAAANSHAQNTQQLLNAAQLAQTAYQQLFQQAQGHAEVAMNAANLAAQLKGLGIQQGQLDLATKTNPLLQAQASKQQMTKDAPKMSFDQFMSQYESDPALAGMTNDEKYNQYINSGGKGQLSNTDLVKYGIHTGNLGQQWGAYLQSALNPATIGGGVGALGTGAAILGAKLGVFKGISGLINLLKGVGPAAEAVAPEAEAAL